VDVSQHKPVEPLSLRALRFHIPMVIAVVGCVWAGLFELSRARAGHTVAWVYAFEWPGFAVVGVIIWWRIITNRDGRRPDVPKNEVEPSDPGLIAWQRYLADARDDEQARRAGSHD
jgi:hypothetical protein